MHKVRNVKESNNSSNSFHLSSQNSRHDSMLVSLPYKSSDNFTINLFDSFFFLDRTRNARKKGRSWILLNLFVICRHHFRKNTGIQVEIISLIHKEHEFLCKSINLCTFSSIHAFFPCPKIKFIPNKCKRQTVNSIS